MPWRARYRNYHVQGRFVVSTSKQGELPDRLGRELPAVKVCLDGPAGAGKSSFCRGLMAQSLVQVYEPTLGVDFAAVRARSEGRWFTVQLWDLAGLERFHSIPQPYRQARAILCCFDVGDPQSLDSLERTWLRPLEEKDRKMTMMLGLKSDLVLERGADNLERGRALTVELQLPFASASSKEGVNVEGALAQCFREIILLLLPASTLPAPSPAAFERRCAVQ